MRNAHERADAVMRGVLGLLLGFLGVTFVVMMALAFGHMVMV